MFRNIPTTMLSLLALMAVSSVAQATEKFGYVDVSRVLNEVEEGKAAKNKLKVEFEGKQKKLDTLQNGLQTKKEAFDKQAAMMKGPARQAKQEELQREFYELQQTYSKMQKELMDSEGEITGRIGDRMKKVVAAIGDRDAYTAIFNSVEAVLYHKHHLDITDAVIQSYNQRFGNGSGKN